MYFQVKSLPDLFSFRDPPKVRTYNFNQSGDPPKKGTIITIKDHKLKEFFEGEVI